MKNANEAGRVTALLAEPQQRGTLDLFNQEILATAQGLLTSEVIRVTRREVATRSALGGTKRFRRFGCVDSACDKAERSKAERSRAKRSRAERIRAEQSRAEWSRVERAGMHFNRKRGAREKREWPRTRYQPRVRG